MISKHQSFKKQTLPGTFSGTLNEMARYSSNFGNKLQMMAAIAKERGFTSNFDMPKSFTPRKTKLRHKMVNSQSDCQTASCIPE